MNRDLISYYSQRAKEYERIYAKPERQEDIRNVQDILSVAFPQKRVLEVGCGTGYWTPSIASSATSVLATDINETVLEIARNKSYPQHNVTVQQKDLYDLAGSYPKEFSAIFAGFVWSHLKREKLLSILSSLHNCLQSGSKVVWIDNQYVEGSNTPISHWDEHGNSYQTRSLDDGSTHLVLKNFPTDDEFSIILKGMVRDIHIQRLDYFWILTYHIL